MNVADKGSVNTPAISFGDVHHSYDGLLVLDDITCSVQQGELLAILGPSGCGKTTLLRVAAGLIRPTSGTVDLGGMTPVQAREGGRIGFAFQVATLLPWRTTLENVLLPLEILGRLHEHPAVEFARHLLTLVGLGPNMNDRPDELSGGMQQRANLARALVTKPKYLFLDEPFGALDGVTRQRLSLQVRELAHTFGQTTVFVTHSVEEALLIADRIAVLTDKPSRLRTVKSVDLGRKRSLGTDADPRWWPLLNEINSLLRE